MKSHLIVVKKWREMPLKYQIMPEKCRITPEQLLDVKQRRARIILSNLVKEGILLKQGNARSTVYVSKIED